ncbi:MAG: hypothetical protein HQK49_05615 [Oligoflexia bacterium]|nr:hypothetical protein [Oligoflexia bacterium]
MTSICHNEKEKEKEKGRNENVDEYEYRNGYRDLKLKNLCSQIARKYSNITATSTSATSSVISNFVTSNSFITPNNISATFANLIKIGDIDIGITSDGIGTKIEIAERAGIYNTLGYDLVAMVVDDLICNGIIPLSIANVLDVDYLDANIVQELMSGLSNAAQRANIVISGGETAELGSSRINGYGKKMHFNWSATAIGYLPKGRSSIIDGKNIRGGDVVIAFKENGFRSNGFTLVRKILNGLSGGSGIEGNAWDLINIQELLTPSTIYSPLLTKIIYEKNIPLKGIAHITGGSFANKLGRVLDIGCSVGASVGAYLDDLFAPCELMREIGRMGGLSDEVMYSYFNMGNGMLLIASKDYGDEIISMAKENNYQAQVAGEIIKERVIKIKSKSKSERVGVIKFNF